jgi:hypothetical protein
MSINEKHFYYRSNDTWIPVHNWFYFFIKIGYYFAEQKEQERKSIMGISVPAIHFLPSLLAMGVIAGVIESVPQEKLLDNHLSTLVQLPEGTLVRFRNNGRTKIAKYMGLGLINGETRLKVQIQNSGAGGLTYFVEKKDVLNISLSNNQKLRIPNNQAGRAEEKESSFLEAIFNNFDFKTIYGYSDQKVCLIGNKGTLEVETKETSFAVISGTTYVSGLLNDILKIRQLQGTNDTHQTDLILSQSKQSDVVLQKSTIIIYSSAMSYLNWSHKYPENDSIILLDRSESQYHLAVDELNNRYIERSNDSETVSPNLSKVPQGIEILFWKEKR